MEYDILLGAKDFLTHYEVPYILMNWDKAQLKQRGVKPEEVMTLMRSYGYQASLNRFDGVQIKDMAEIPEKEEASSQTNVYWSRQ